MPTATLTWSAPHGDSNLQSTFSATNQGAIQLLNQYLTTLAGFGDFPWEVCSFEGTTAPWFVTLKRKNGNPGRIVFVGVTTVPGTTYNPQFGNLNWNVAGVRAAFFPAATSDTPGNILATSGDVFTNPAGGSGMGPNVSMTAGSNMFTAFACDDGIVFRYGTATTIATLNVVGDFLEDNLGNQAPISAMWGSGTMDGIAPSIVPAVGTSGGFALRAGTTIHYGTGWQAPTLLSSYQRDNALKRSWFHPRSLCCVSLPLGEAMKYKLRQIAYGPAPLAANEQLSDTGAVLKAVSLTPNTTAGFPWLTNFKV